MVAVPDASFPGGRNLLGNIRRRNGHFRRRDAVIRQNHLQLIATAGSLLMAATLLIAKMMFFAGNSPAPPSRQTGIRAVRGRPAGFADLFVQCQNVRVGSVLTFGTTCRRLFGISNRVA